MIRVAIVVGKMNSGGKKNLIMEYYRHIEREKFQFELLFVMRIQKQYQRRKLKN